MQRTVAILFETKALATSLGIVRRKAAVDKAAFIEKAPVYYALAIVHTLHRKGGDGTTRTAVLEMFTTTDDTSQEDYCHILNKNLFELAINWLVTQGLVDVIPSDFGSPFIEPTKEYQKRMSDLRAVRSSPFWHYTRNQDSMRWLLDALADIERAEASLLLNAADYGIKDREWEPLALDREEPDQKEVTTSIDRVTDLVEQANEYAVAEPTERQYVLDNLRQFGRTLKESTVTSIHYINRHAVEPLIRLGKRFSKAAMGLAIEAAKESIRTWLKNKFGIYLGHF